MTAFTDLSFTYSFGMAEIKEIELRKCRNLY